MNYATFRQRFMAMWIDAFVLLPLMVIQGLIGSNSKAAAFVLVIPMNVVSDILTSCGGLECERERG